MGPSELGTGHGAWQEIQPPWRDWGKRGDHCKRLGFAHGAVAPALRAGEHRGDRAGETQMLPGLEGKARRDLPVMGWGAGGEVALGPRMEVTAWGYSDAPAHSGKAWCRESDLHRGWLGSSAPGRARS